MKATAAPGLSGSPGPAAGPPSAGAPGPAAGSPSAGAPGPAAAPIATGEPVLLWEPETGRRWLVAANGGARKVGGLGVFDAGRLVGMSPGETAEAVGKRLVVLRPTPADLQATIRRKAQTIGPKDLSRILWELGLRDGMRVLESGIGSASATIGLASAVTPTGRVVVQELREDFAQWGMDNVEAAGLGALVKVVVGDISQGVCPGVEGPFDAVLLDVPEPWNAVATLRPHMAAGGRIACYVPQVSQMEQAYRALEAAGFAGVWAMETIEREWEVKPRGSRPSFEGLGHTAFLVFARRPGGP